MVFSRSKELVSAPLRCVGRVTVTGIALAIAFAHAPLATATEPASSTAAQISRSDWGVLADLAGGVYAQSDTRRFEYRWETPGSVLIETEFRGDEPFIVKTYRRVAGQSGQLQVSGKQRLAPSTEWTGSVQPDGAVYLTGKGLASQSYGIGLGSGGELLWLDVRNRSGAWVVKDTVVRGKRKEASGAALAGTAPADGRATAAPVTASLDPSLAKLLASHVANDWVGVEQQAPALEGQLPSIQGWWQASLGRAGSFRRAVPGGTRAGCAPASICQVVEVYFDHAALEWAVGVDDHGAVLSEVFAPLPKVWGFSAQVGLGHYFVDVAGYRSKAVVSWVTPGGMLSMSQRAIRGSDVGWAEDHVLVYSDDRGGIEFFEGERESGWRFFGAADDHGRLQLKTDRGGWYKLGVKPLYINRIDDRSFGWFAVPGDKLLRTYTATSEEEIASVEKGLLDAKREAEESRSQMFGAVMQGLAQGTLDGYNNYQSASQWQQDTLNQVQQSATATAYARELEQRQSSTASSSLQTSASTPSPAQPSGASQPSAPTSPSQVQFVMQVPLAYEPGDTANKLCMALVTIPTPLSWLESGGNNMAGFEEALNARKAAFMQRCNAERPTQGSPRFAATPRMRESANSVRQFYDEMVSHGNVVVVQL